MRLAERSAGRLLSTVEITGEPAVKADVRGSAPHTGEAAARGASCFSHVPGHLVQIISHYGVSVIDPQGEVLEKRGTVEKHVVHNKMHSGARTGCWYPNEGHRIRLTMLCSEQGERWAHGFVNRRSGVRFPSPAPTHKFEGRVRRNLLRPRFLRSGKQGCCKSAAPTRVFVLS